MRHTSLLILACMNLATTAAWAAPSACAATVQELARMTGEPAFPLKWTETTMGDGKPLLVSIAERQGMLALEINKTREGLWAESTGVICPSGSDLEIVFSREQVRLGPAANWLMRQTLGQGGSFRISRLATDRLKISTVGWSGHFVPMK